MSLQSGNTPSEQAWRARAEKALGATLETLTTQTADGIAIHPLYPSRRDDAPRPWRRDAAWSVSPRIDHPDVEAANRAALAELEGGADALTLVLAASPYARGYGLAGNADLDLVLEGVELDLIRLRLDAGADTLAAARSLAQLVESRVLTSAALDVDLGFDPIGLAARTGTPSAVDSLGELLDIARKAGLSGRPLLADGRPYHEAGAGEALELATVLATGVAYMRRLESTGLGLGLDEAQGAIAVLLAVDADVFPSLAKIRAVRRLWARIETASGLEARPLRLHAETSWRMMTRRDPWTNAMRATAATFAAGLGGADVVTVLPMTLAIGLPDAPARRLARNVQRVLIDESNLAMVDDPVAGAGGFEALTDGLCERAWALFQEIEREGGIEASLTSGKLRARLSEAATARARRVATLDQGIVGTSRFPSLDAPAPGILDVAPHLAPTLGSAALPCLRDAVPFEALRDRAETAGEDARPKVFLATLGTPAAFGGRATYARNFFAAAGLEAIPPLQERDTRAIAESFAGSAGKVACLCGTDKAYAADAVEVAQALRAAGAQLVLLAGRTSEDIAGIDACIHDGCDALQVLSAALDVLVPSADDEGAAGR